MACGSLHISSVSNTREMSRAVHQRQTVLDSLLEGAALQMPLLSLANQSSALPSHATTIAKADFPNDGLLRPPRTPYGLLWSLKGAMDTYTHIHTQLNNSNSPHEEMEICWQGTPVSASVTGGHGWSQSLTNPGYYQAFVQPAAVTYKASGRKWGGQKGIHDLSL